MLFGKTLSSRRPFVCERTLSAIALSRTLVGCVSGLSVPIFIENSAASPGKRTKLTASAVAAEVVRKRRLFCMGRRLSALSRTLPLRDSKNAVQTRGTQRREDAGTRRLDGEVASAIAKAAKSTD